MWNAEMGGAEKIVGASAKVFIFGVEMGKINQRNER